MEQTEQDFRTIERERDLPPDEPYEQADRCPNCGRPADDPDAPGDACDHCGASDD